MNTKGQIDIFIVEDNSVFSLTLKAYIENAFKHLSVNVHLFETGESCLEEFIRTVPELVILDYYLNSKFPSAVDGLEVLDKIKIYNFKTKVIMLTSNDHIDIALKSFDHGASDYVVKSNNPFIKINHSITKIFAQKELKIQESRKEKQAIELMIANKELNYLNGERERKAIDLVRSRKEFSLQILEKEKWAADLVAVNIQMAEVERSRSIIEQKNKNITDSINYAKRIQLAKLPRKEEIDSALTNSFVLFKPKDIVSGDFYFFQQKGETLFIAAADCTGHGVPGAFMSMIGSEKLEEAVALSSNPSEILRHLNVGIRNSLHQSDCDESTKDGMDIAFCTIDINNLCVNYAGANRPLWIIKKGSTELIEVKATKKAIGGYTYDDQYFDNHTLQLQEGDTFYIFTDGYVDQFGGQNGKKLMAKKFREILLAIQQKSMEDQKIHLENFVENWSVGVDQVDDILVIGIRL